VAHPRPDVIRYNPPAVNIRILACLLLLGPVADAQDSYGQLLREAARLENELRPGDKADAPVDRAYRKLAEAAQLAPQRWEAFALRGTNRCMKAMICRRILEELISEMRARGRSPEFVKAKTQAGLEYIEAVIQDAVHDFTVMERNMRAAGRPDADRIRFAMAAVKYARGRYLKNDAGEAGAIDEFKELVRSGWQVRHCSEFIARCYLHLGFLTHVGGDVAGAQAHWDEALRWAQEGATRRTVLSNKAAAFELEAEYGATEKILREQTEAEPNQPVHWKNLGLVLGYQNRLREALHAYGRARQACREADVPFFLGLLHGNAWLKPAMIHGKLLEEDGDVRVAWRLFLEYREMLGDDYAFCLNFGDFAFQHGQHELAWTYLTRARDLQPACPNPYQLLMQLAPRVPGDPAEVKARVAKAKEELERTRKNYRTGDAAWRLNRLCAGLRDGADSGGLRYAKELLDPDPLAGFGLGRPPEWVVKAAGLRQPFRPFEPAGAERTPEATEAPPPAHEPRGLPWWVVLAPVLLVLALLGLLFRRSQKEGRHS
jgi:tetratricopeptide (TPR) repeat protein